MTVAKLALLLRLERAALEQACAAPADAPITADVARVRAANRMLRQSSAALEAERDTWRMVATRLARCSDEAAQSAFNAAVREHGHPDYPATQHKDPTHEAHLLPHLPPSSRSA